MKKEKHTKLRKKKQRINHKWNQRARIYHFECIDRKKTTELRYKSHIAQLLSWYERINNNNKKQQQQQQPKHKKAPVNHTKEMKIMGKEVNQSEKLQNENTNKTEINVKLWNSCSGLVCVAWKFMRPIWTFGQSIQILFTKYGIQ